MPSVDPFTENGCVAKKYKHATGSSSNLKLSMYPAICSGYKNFCNTTQQMLTQGTGVIVNTSAIAGLIAFPGISPYVASKHAVVGLTRAAALDYAKQGIRINAVNPGAIATEMFARSIDRMGITADETLPCLLLHFKGRKSCLKQ